MKALRLYIALVIVAAAVLLCSIALSGCGHWKPAGGQAAAALASADTHNTEAYTLGKEVKHNVEGAVPNSNELGKQYLAAALRQLGDMLTSIAGEKVATTELRQAVADKDGQINGLKARLDAYDGGWLGGKAQRLVVWVKWALAGVVVVGLVLQAVGMGIGGYIGKALGFVGRVILSFVPFVSTIFHDLFAVMHRKNAVAEVKVQAANDAAYDVINQMRQILAGWHIASGNAAIPSTGAVGGSYAPTTMNV